MNDPLRTEAALLAKSLLGWARGVATTLDPKGIHLTDQSSCEGCPLCRLLARLRAEDPELAASLTNAINDTAAGVARMMVIMTSAVTSHDESGSKPAKPVHDVPIVEEPE